jgi:DNA-binding beta-propeller fold protein YncE
MSLRTTLKAALCAIGCALAVPGAAQAAEPPMRDVLVVSNNWAGTADIVDQRSLKRLKRLNVIPDRDQRIAEIVTDPTRKFYFDNIRTLVGEGNNQYVDDGFLSKDGRTVYFSRPSFADVVALDVRTGAVRWRVPVDGYRADHMALSPDGRRLLVSASTARTVDVIDPRRGRIVGRFPSGDSPHENNYSSDGKLIFQASIGTVYTDADAPSEDASKGERIFEVVDARTLKVRKRIDMGAKMAEFGVQASGAVRPMAVSPDERFVYMQLSFLHGFVEYDLRTDSVRRVAALPVPADVRRLPRTDYLLDSAHHGLAMNPQGTKLCAAGTMSRYAAIVRRSTLQVQRVVRVGRTPYWAASGTDGRHCFVSVAGEDRVAVLDWSTAREVASIRVGDHPQRMRTGRVLEASL